MTAPRKESTRRTSKAAAGAKASAAVAETVPAENVDGQLPIAEPVVEAPETETSAVEAPETETSAVEAPVVEDPEAEEPVVQDARASLLAKFVNPEAAAAPVKAEEAPAVPASGNTFTIPADEGQDLVQAICLIDLYVVRNKGVTYQLFKGDTITAPAELLARGFEFKVLAEQG